MERLQHWDGQPQTISAYMEYNASGKHVSGFTGSWYWPASGDTALVFSGLWLSRGVLGTELQQPPNNTIIWHEKRPYKNLKCSRPHSYYPERRQTCSDHFKWQSKMGNSPVGRAFNWKARHNTDVGSSPGCSKGFFSQSQLSVQTLLQCPYSPHVQLHASTSVHTLKFPGSNMSYKHLWKWTMLQLGISSNSF